MKAVLMSIQPKWCELIASGKKTVEVRKTKPKLEVPFKVYIYETKDKRYENVGVMGWKDDGTGYNFVNRCGKVIGEFVCDAMVVDRTYGHDDPLYRAACMEAADIAAYCVNPKMYAWHISELKIYDKPKELSEFLVEDNRTFDCPQLVAMKRAPQSWCYVEGVRDNG